MKVRLLSKVKSLDMKLMHTIAFSLLIIGGLNWLLTAFNYNVVDMIFGAGSAISMVIYVLVGLSAIFEAHSTHPPDADVVRPFFPAAARKQSRDRTILPLHRR